MSPFCMKEFVSPIRVHAAVLAGGRSSRMKTDKRFLKIQGELLVDRAVRLAKETLQPFGGEVLLCGDVPERKSLPDAASGLGPLSGLLSALNKLTNSEGLMPTWLLILPVDMPLLNSELLGELTSKIQQTDGLDSDAIAFDDFEMPFVVRVNPFVKKAVEELCQKKAPSNRSIRALLRQLRVKSIPLASKFQGAMMNANLPSDWIRISEEVPKG